MQDVTSFSLAAYKWHYNDFDPILFYFYKSRWSDFSGHFPSDAAHHKKTHFPNTFSQSLMTVLLNSCRRCRTATTTAATLPWKIIFKADTIIGNYCKCNCNCCLLCCSRCPDVLMRFPFFFAQFSLCVLSVCVCVDFPDCAVSQRFDNIILIFSNI